MKPYNEVIQRSPRPRVLALMAALLFSTGALAVQDSNQPVSDAWAESKIWSSYALDTHLNPFEISVDVEGDLAILSGEVDEAVDRELAERLALNVEEIARVENRIVVVDQAADEVAARRDVGDVIADSAITAAVKSRLLWNERTDGLAINVDTAQGRVRLTGEADTELAVQTAERLALDTDGVVSVDNRLTIVADPAMRTTALDRAAEAVDDSWITTKIKSSLMYSSNVDGLDISVRTQDGHVHLGGSASDAAERDLAVEIARDIRGVRDVDASAVAIGGQERGR